MSSQPQSFIVVERPSAEGNEPTSGLAYRNPPPTFLNDVRGGAFVFCRDVRELRPVASKDVVLSRYMLCTVTHLYITTPEGEAVRWTSFTNIQGIVTDARSPNLLLQPTLQASILLGFANSMEMQDFLVALTTLAPKVQISSSDSLFALAFDSIASRGGGGDISNNVIPPPPAVPLINRSDAAEGVSFKVRYEVLMKTVSALETEINLREDALRLSQQQSAVEIARLREEIATLDQINANLVSKQTQLTNSTTRIYQPTIDRLEAALSEALESKARVTDELLCAKRQAAWNSLPPPRPLVGDVGVQTDDLYSHDLQLLTPGRSRYPTPSGRNMSPARSTTGTSSLSPIGLGHVTPSRASRLGGGLSHQGGPVGSAGGASMVSAFTTAEVGELLDVLGISSKQMKAKFANVDGGMLLELHDTNNLKTRLGDDAGALRRLTDYLNNQDTLLNEVKQHRMLRKDVLQLAYAIHTRPALLRSLADVYSYSTLLTQSLNHASDSVKAIISRISRTLSSVLVQCLTDAERKHLGVRTSASSNVPVEKVPPSTMFVDLGLSASDLEVVLRVASHLSQYCTNQMQLAK